MRGDENDGSVIAVGAVVDVVTVVSGRDDCAVPVYVCVCVTVRVEVMFVCFEGLQQLC